MSLKKENDSSNGLFSYEFFMPLMMESKRLGSGKMPLCNFENTRILI